MSHLQQERHFEHHYERQGQQAVDYPLVLRDSKWGHQWSLAGYNKLFVPLNRKAVM
jgi:hypothetical protein